jgi:hypothetical protein
MRLTSRPEVTLDGGHSMADGIRVMSSRREGQYAAQTAWGIAVTPKLLSDYTFNGGA